MDTHPQVYDRGPSTLKQTNTQHTLSVNENASYESHHLASEEYYSKKKKIHFMY